MATKTAIASGDDQPFKKPKVFGNALSAWTDFTRFLSDVRAEMRKVVAPSRKEVQVTTSVVIVAVFIFGVFFFIVDWIFRVGVNGLLSKLGGMQ
jgi:preprotein translocase subunit SecE